jgi:hypothetical protein
VEVLPAGAAAPAGCSVAIVDDATTVHMLLKVRFFRGGPRGAAALWRCVAARVRRRRRVAHGVVAGAGRSRSSACGRALGSRRRRRGPRGPACRRWPIASTPTNGASPHAHMQAHHAADRLTRPRNPPTQPPPPHTPNITPASNLPTTSSSPLPKNGFISSYATNLILFNTRASWTRPWR